MWSKIFASELETSAARAWDSIREAAQLPTSGWTHTRLSKRDDPHIASITSLAEHASGLQVTFKHQLHPHVPEGFSKHYNMQAAAYQAVPETDTFALPAPVHLCENDQSSLLAFAPGLPLSELMFDAVGDLAAQRALLTRAGAWLDHYHRSQMSERRNFQPKFTVNYYAKLREQIESGSTRIAAKPLYLRGISHLRDIAPSFAGQGTVAAAQHGDFHMRNLICEGTRMTGIDVSKIEPAPVGYDIAKILLDYTAIIRGADDIRPGEVIPDDARAAFFDGYTLVGPDDPSVRFLLYARILATLIHVPAKQSDRTDAKQQTLRRLKPIAENAFGNG